MTQRRQFLTAAAGLATAGWGTAFTGAAWAQAASDLGTPSLPESGVRRLPLGDFELLAVHDGITRRPLTEGFVRNQPLEMVRSVLSSQGLPTDYVDLSFTAFLIVGPGRRVLIDAGNGEFGSPTSGRLVANLARAGITQDSIDTVLISHFHGDHINGLRRRDGSWVFPKARVMVPEPEWAYWMDDERMKAAPDAMKAAFATVRRVFRPVAAQLKKFEPDAQLLPGFKAVPAHGHTPGQSMFEVESKDQKFLYLGDVANVPALFVHRPDWVIQFDMDADTAVDVRRNVLEDAATEGTLVGGYHFPFPAVGTVLKEVDGYEFDPYRVL